MQSADSTLFASDVQRQTSDQKERQTSDPISVAIAGAGLMGRVLALFLVRAGHRVTLFDRDPVDTGSAAAYTSAGMLAPWAELEDADLNLFRLGLRSLELWPRILEWLGADVGFRQSGSLVVAHRADRVDLQHFQRRLVAKVDDPRQVHKLDGAALAQREPALAGVFSEALWLPGEACLDSRRALAAMADTLLASGVDWQAQTEVTAVAPKRVETPRGERCFDVVADCRGLGARGDLEGLRGVRGEVLWLRAPGLALARPVRLLHPRYRIYLVPRADDLYVLGATQIESDQPGPITVRSSLELLSAAYSLHPALAEAEVVHSDANCRTALDDNQPLVDVRPGLVRINGLFRHGWLLAPALAEQAVERAFA